MKLTLNTDGGARGNPGPAAIGAVIKNEKGEIIKEVSKYIGKTTNNEAEYRALIEGIKAVLEIEDDGKKNDKKDLLCILDSELAVKQLNGEYKVKHENMKIFWNEVKNLEKNFNSIKYTHVKREKNKRADFLVNEVLDSLK